MVLTISQRCADGFILRMVRATGTTVCDILRRDLNERQILNMPDLPNVIQNYEEGLFKSLLVLAIS